MPINSVTLYLRSKQKETQIRNTISIGKEMYNHFNNNGPTNISPNSNQYNVMKSLYNNMTKGYTQYLR